MARLIGAADDAAPEPGRYLRGSRKGEIGQRGGAEHTKGRVDGGHPSRHRLLEIVRRRIGQLAAGHGQLGTPKGTAADGESSPTQAQGDLLGLALAGGQLGRQPSRLEWFL